MATVGFLSFATGQTGELAPPHPLRSELESLRSVLRGGDLAVRLRDFEKAKRLSGEALESLDRLKFDLMPFMERLKVAVELQKDVSEGLRPPWERELSLLGSEEKQRKNLAHVVALLNQNGKGLENAASGSGSPSVPDVKIREAVQLDLQMALSSQREALSGFGSQSYNRSLRSSNDAKFHLENALKRFRNQGNPDGKEGNDGNRNPARNQASASDPENETPPQNPSDPQARAGQSPSPDSAEGETGSENPESGELTPEQAGLELERLLEEARRERQRRLREAGDGQARQTGRAKVDKDW